jgi:putative redox protein
MSDITAELREQFPIKVRIREFECEMDVPERLGGTDQAPTPTEFFLAAIAACKVVYAARFLERRGIARTSIRATLDSEKGDNRVEKVTVTLELPEDFPKDQVSGLRRMVEGCYVTQSIQRPTEIELILPE